MDDLLAQLKAEFEPKRGEEKNLPTPPPSKSSTPPQNSASMERMLDELRMELESGRRSEENLPDKPKTSTTVNKSAAKQVRNERKYRDRLNTLIDQDYQMQARKREAKFAEQRKKEAKRIEAEKRRQQELLEAQKQAELRERRRKEALQEKAQEWLAKLNPRSEEGKWFEEFSYSYEDKLQAAVDYLEAMRESGL